MADAPPLEPAPRPKTSNPRWAWAILAIVLLIHGIQAVRLFPTLRSIVDDSPVVMVDHAIHEYHGALGARFLKEQGTTWGFDPFFMAGYPETPVWDSSSNLAILFQAGSGRYSPRAYKLGLLICSLLAMIAVPTAAGVAGLGTAEAAGAAVLAWVYFWAGYPVDLWRTGLFAFTFASAGAALMISLCVRFDRHPTRAVWAAMAASGAFLFFAHVTAPILVVGGLLPLYGAAARRHSRRWHAALWLAAGLVLAVNLGWLALLWRFRGIRQAPSVFLTSDSWRFLPYYYLGYLLDGHLGLILLVAGSAGIAIWAADGRRTLAVGFGGAAAALLILGGFGSLWNVTRALEPVRFLVPLNLLLSIPAGTAIARGTACLVRVAGGGIRGFAAAGVAWLIVLVAAGMSIPGTARSLVNRRQLAVGTTPEMTELVEWLRTNTDPSARILFEDQLRVLESSIPESVHWTPLLPVLLRPDRRQFIGGLYQTALIRHHRMAAFGDFRLGDRAIDEWTPDKLREYFDLYNVGWVVCWSPLSRFWFDRYPAAHRVATLPRYSSHLLPDVPNRHEWEAMIPRAGAEVVTRYLMEGDWNYAIYRVDRPHSFFLRGLGRVTSVDANRIELADVVPHEGAILLSLHWLETWKTDPPLRVQPEQVPLDPVDFVRIEVPGPISRLVLYNGYGRR